MPDLRAGISFLIPNCRNLPLLSRITLRFHVEGCMPGTPAPAEQMGVGRVLQDDGVSKAR